MAAIYSNGGNRWNILGFNFSKRDALSSLYKISMHGSVPSYTIRILLWYISIKACFIRRISVASNTISTIDNEA